MTYIGMAPYSCGPMARMPAWEGSSDRSAVVQGQQNVVSLVGSLLTGWFAHCLGLQLLALRALSLPHHLYSYTPTNAMALSSLSCRVWKWKKDILRASRQNPRELSPYSSGAITTLYLLLATHTTLAGLWPIQYVPTALQESHILDLHCKQEPSRWLWRMYLWPMQ